jgi:hypothetical protein
VNQNRLTRDLVEKTGFLFGNISYSMYDVLTEMFYTGVQWVLEALSPEVKRLRREADHPPPSRAEVKDGGAIPPLPYTFSRFSA